MNIAELFEWFKTRLEAAKQAKKGNVKKSSPREWSGTASSFDDTSTDTRSMTTTKNTQTRTVDNQDNDPN